MVEGDITVKIENLRADIDELTDSHDALARMQANLQERFAEAFPGGDHVGHCRYHQIMIENVEWKKRLVQALAEKTIGGIVIAALAGIGYACWLYVKQLVKLP